MERYILSYTQSETKEPLLAKAVLETGVLVNILTADVGYSKGTMVVSVIGDEKKRKSLVDFLQRNGVGVERLEGNIVKDDERCVDCCACYGVCPTRAISIDGRRMSLDNDECIRCKACVEACPTRALTLQDA